MTPEREFYELMQAYRTAPHVPQTIVIEAFEAVKAYIEQRERAAFNAGWEAEDISFDDWRKGRGED